MRLGRPVHEQDPALYVATTDTTDVRALPSVMPPEDSITTAKFQELLILLRELASTHILLSIALIGIILLQCGKYYSVRLQERERNEEVDVRLVRRLRQRQQQER